MDDPALRVYVGTETEQLLTFQVLAYSIQRHARRSVQVIPLNQAFTNAGITLPPARSSRTRQHTPFSFQRFAIPQITGYKGKAIYLDSDMLVFQDIHELVKLLPVDADVAAATEPAGSTRSSQISVMVLDCEKLDWDIHRIMNDLEAGAYTYRQLYSDLPISRRFSRTLPHYWNDLERHTPGQTALTHFTDMETQPWLYARHRLGDLWCKELMGALDAGMVTLDLIREQVLKGWLRPSLVYQIEHDLVDPAELPESILNLDLYGFTPPHRVGILPKAWMRRLASRLTAYGKQRPGPAARMMRSFQAVGYQVYRHLRGNRLLAH